MSGIVKCQEKTGPAKVTFGSFDSAQKCYAKFKAIDIQDTYELSLYKDSGYRKPYQTETFKGSDVCGMDWGSFEQQKKVAKYFYKPVKTYTYVTIINKTKSISLLFSGDEGSQLNDWKDSLKELLYGGSTYMREKLIYEGESVMLQIGKLNISLTEDRKDNEPAKRKQSWPKEMMYECSVEGRTMSMAMKSSHHEGSTNVSLECHRGAFHDGKVVTPEETIAQIRNDVSGFVIQYMYTEETIYEQFQDVLYTDYGSDYYDLNKLDDLQQTCGGDVQVRSNMEEVHKKIKDTEGQYTEPHNPKPIFRLSAAETFAFNAGHIIQQIRRHPPIPDTLHLPHGVRTDICLRLYTDNELGRTGDWTALASQIGIKQGAVNILKGIYNNEKSIDPAAEIILRHWQYTYNKYWDKPESDYPDRPKLPCTMEGLIKALKNMGRNDLVRMVSPKTQET